MFSRTELIGRLRQLPTHSRAGFAAGCAERVLRIFELDCDRTDRRPRNGLEVVWRFACGGPVDSVAVADAKEAVSEATPKIEEQGDHLTAAMAACIAVIASLDAIHDPTGEAATD